jgi:hypothetical protein
MPVRGVLIAMLVFPADSTRRSCTFCRRHRLWLGTVPLTNGLVGQIFACAMPACSAVVFFGHQIGSFVGVAAVTSTTRRSLHAGAFLASIGLSVFARSSTRRSMKAACPRRAPAATSKERLFSLLVGMIIHGGGGFAYLKPGMLRVRQPGAVLLMQNGKSSSHHRSGQVIEVVVFSKIAARSRWCSARASTT